MAYGSRLRGSRPQIRELLLSQWNRLTGREVDATNYEKSRLARLIERKYGIDAVLVESYFTNMERRLPVMGY